MLVSTHDLAEVARAADRIVLLEAGRTKHARGWPGTRQRPARRWSASCSSPDDAVLDPGGRRRGRFVAAEAGARSGLRPCEVRGDACGDRSAVLALRGRVRWCRRPGGVGSRRMGPAVDTGGRPSSCTMAAVAFGATAWPQRGSRALVVFLILFGLLASTWSSTAPDGTANWLDVSRCALLPVTRSLRTDRGPHRHPAFRGTIRGCAACVRGGLGRGWSP